MKTTLQWLQTLPKPYRTQAINNHRKYKSTLTKEQQKDYNKKEEKSLVSAIGGAFLWLTTSEGIDYWSEVSNIARKEETINNIK